MKLLDAIHKKFKLASVTKVRKLIKSGFVRVNNLVVTRPDADISHLDQLELVEHAQRRKQKAPFEILFEDEAILVTVKPAGILVKDFHKQLCAYIPVILTHRLDRKVSGVMIFAKSFEIERRLEADWPQFEKIYVALVEGNLSKAAGTIESCLAENKALKVYSVPQGTPGAKKAVTHYRQLAGNRVEIHLETGRKNQIRVHLSELGCPIVGDEKYGARTDMKGRIALHAWQLSLNHPVSGKRMTFSKEAPF